MPNETSNKAKMVRWLRPLVFVFDPVMPRCVNVLVRHVNVNDKPSDVRNFKILGGEEFDEAALMALVNDVEMCLDDDVEGIGGHQKYMLVAQDEEAKQVGRLAVRVSAPMDDEDGEVSTEPATAKGLLAANMRHVDNAHRMAVGASATIITAQQRMLSRQMETIENMTAKALSTITLAEQLLSQRHEREMEAENLRAAQKRKDKFFSGITGLLSPIAKKLTGAAGGTGSDMPFNQEEMKALFEGMTEEEFAAFKQTLSPERFFLLLSLMQSFKPDSTTEGTPRGDDEPDTTNSGPNGH